MSNTSRPDRVVPVQPLQLQRMLTFTVLLMVGFAVVIGRPSIPESTLVIQNRRYVDLTIDYRVNCTSLAH